jgi:hypothetical protein
MGDWGTWTLKADGLCVLAGERSQRVKQLKATTGFESAEWPSG